MESARALIPVALLAAIGCTSLKSVSIRNLTDDIEVALELKEPPAATEFACAWQNRLQQLPDPSRDGAMTTGLVGQAFLFTPDMTPAEIRGDLTIIVADAAAAPGTDRKPEVYHFTAETLRKMVVTDERFGRSVVLFLPWPAEWRNVSRLTIQARYDQKDQHTLYAQPTSLTLDLSAGSGPSAGGVVPSPNARPMAVPDPKEVLKSIQTSSPVMPAGGLAPR